MLTHITDYNIKINALEHFTLFFRVPVKLFVKKCAQNHNRYVSKRNECSIDVINKDC